ncbi:MAG TPA: DUF2079 domain-containing protein [Kineosporiaceae bacterium]
MVTGDVAEPSGARTAAARRRPWAAVVGLPAGALYLALDWVRFSTGRSGNYDLGIFAQAAQSWAGGDWPRSAIRGLDTLFADHFSPITILFGLGWLVWPDPRSLLVVQSLALGLTVVLVGAAAGRQLPSRVAVPVTLAAAVAKGVVSAASFDVHETALGAPVMAGLAWGLLERRRRVVVGCSAALLLVKEDLGLTVLMAAGVWWWLVQDRRTALGLAGLGLAGFVIANVVVVVAAPDHRNPYLQFLAGASGNPQGLTGAEVHGGTRWAPALLFLLAAGVVGLRSPLAVLAVPTLGWRAASSNVSYWQTYFHYDAVLVPVAAFALIDVVARLRRPGGATATRAAAGVPTGVVAGVVAGSLAWSAAIGSAKVAAWQPWHPQRYVPTSRMRDAAALGGLVPRGGPVVAQQDLGPAVLARVDVRMLSDTVAVRGRWVLLSSDGGQLGAPQAAKARWLAAELARPDVRVVRRGDCLLVGLPGEENVLLRG